MHFLTTTNMDLACESQVPALLSVQQATRPRGFGGSRRCKGVLRRGPCMSVVARPRCPTYGVLFEVEDENRSQQCGLPALSWMDGCGSQSVLSMLGRRNCYK